MVVRFDTARGFKFCERTTGRVLTDAEEIATLILHNPEDILLITSSSQEGHC